MKRLIFFFHVAYLSLCLGQTVPDSVLYLGQVPPKDSAIVFAPGIISLTGRTENRITFSPDKKMCFVSAAGGPVAFLEYKNGAWTAPYTLNSKFKSEPFFSLDGKKVYLNSRAALAMVGACDISYSSRTDTVWSDPTSLGAPPNVSGEQYHPSIVADSSIYFSAGSGEICRCQYKNRVYQQRVVLPYPINYANTSSTWGDPYVAPDESFLIFRSTRTGGYGGNDIYISYKKTDGSWTNPKNLGNKINTSGDEFSGDITPDGKYMTFGRNNDIYWVSARFVDSLRQTNFIPYVKTQIPNQVDTIGRSLTYRISDTTFIDDDGNSTLSYTATLSNGSSLPVWLSFDAITKTFSGILTIPGTSTIKLIAKDTANATVSCQFTITVANATTVQQEKGQVPTESQLLQNYPNPFNPSTIIEYDLPKDSRVKITVFDMLGRLVRTLVDEDKSGGSYKVEFNADNLSSGVYYYHLQTNDFTQTKKLVLMR